MINPRSLLRTLEKNWEFIDYLISNSREQLTWQSDELFTAMNRVYVQESLIQQQDRLQQLINTDILQELPRSIDFELNNAVRDFAHQLINEHQLGLSDIIKVRINEIKNALQIIYDAVQQRDMSALQRGILIIDAQLRYIHQQLQQDTHAIADIAQRFKTADTQMPLARRYLEVLETYEKYIIPMEQLMDTSINGEFYFLLEKASNTIDELREQLSMQGALITHQRQLTLLSFRIKELRSLGYEKLKECVDILLPLREEYRRHSELSSAIAKLLGDIRKRGLKRTINSHQLPLWRKEITRRIIIDDSLQEFLARARNYIPKTIDFPEIIDTGEVKKQDYIDENAIQQHLLTHLPIEDLMQWLIQHYNHYSDITLIKLYHRILRLNDIHAQHHYEITHQTLTHHRISLYSHRITRHEY